MASPVTTVAALAALRLREALADGPEGSCRRFTAAAGRIVDQVWDLSAGSDLDLPFVPGPRPLRNRLLNRYVDLIGRAGTVDADIAERFVRVANMLDGPEALLAPRTVLGVVRGARAASRVPAGTTGAPRSRSLAQTGSTSRSPVAR